MTEDEIFALAESLGLDRARLKLYEPFNWRQWGRRYRMEYLAEDGQCHEYDFMVSLYSIREGLEDYTVRYFVEDGLIWISNETLAAKWIEEWRETRNRK